MDTSFPFLLAGWSVGVRSGRYRATQTSMDGRNYTPEKGDGPGGRVSLPDHRRSWCDLTLEGESGFGEVAHQLGNNRGGGGARGSPWISDVQDFPALGSQSSTDAGRRECPVSEDDDMPARLPVSNPEMGNPGDATCRCCQVVAAKTCSGLVRCEGECCREASVGRGAGVFSRAGPTDVWDDWIRGPVQRRRDYGPG